MQEDEADELLRHIVGPDAWPCWTSPERREFETAWKEQEEGEWVVVLHFRQGPNRFEHRLRDLPELFGETRSAADRADYIAHFIVMELHGNDFPRSNDGRCLREGWG